MTLPATPVRFRDYVFDRGTGDVSRAGCTVRLPEKPRLALSVLVTRANEIVSREDLCRALWPAGTFVDFDANLNATIKRLREALGDSADAPRIIETLPRVGYRFIAPIERDPPTARFHQYVWGVLAAAAALAITIAAFTNVPPTPRVPQLPAPRVFRLAAVSFENLTGQADREFMSDGLSAEIGERLRRLAPDRLIVIAYERPKHAAAPSDAAIARELGVDYVLRGALERREQGEALRTQLTDVHASACVWTATFRLPLQEVFVQHDVAARVATMLSLSLAAENRDQLSRAFTTNTSAHAAYLRGLKLLTQDNDAAVFHALEAFRESARHDPRYALPYAGIAAADLRLGKSRVLSPRRAEAAASAAISEGLMMDPSIPSFALLRAVMLANDPGRDREAAAAYRQAIALDPADAEAHTQYALFLRERHPAEGLAEIDRARSLEPKSPWINAVAGSLLISNGKLADADAQLHAALSLDHTLPWTLFYLGNLDMKRGQPQRAIEWFEKAAAASGWKPFYLYRLGLAYSQSGRAAETRATFVKLRGRSKQEFVDPMFIQALETALAR